MQRRIVLALISSAQKHYAKLQFMDDEKKLPARARPGREPFTTIDDLAEQAEELAIGLRKLREQRYPLDIRRGVTFKEQGINGLETGSSKALKAGAKTYFFDIKHSRDEKPYLVITESRFRADGKKRERNTIIVFPEQAEAFTAIVCCMVHELH